MRLCLGKIHLSVLGVTLLAACTDEQNQPPVAQATSLATVEEQAVAAQLSGADPEGAPLSYGIGAARHGRVTSLTPDGAFTFEPDVDFFGAAGFDFFVVDDQGQSAQATVSITVENVNDPPLLAAVPDLQNSPESEVVEYQVSVVDPDPDEHAFSISAADPNIVEASVDAQSGRLFLKALQIGVTNIEVSVADGAYTDRTEFTFSADQVTKVRVLRYTEIATGAVVLRNETDRPIDFVLEHNGFPVFEDVESMVEYVQALPAQYVGEDFPHKLWRFVRDSVYHDVPLNAKRWFYDPWATLNSLGWGFCGHVAGVFVVIAREAGYEARVWGLDGHVVPEIRVDGQWRMYDPDLAVYYKTPDGRIAGVEELAANPTLITSPIEPIFQGSAYQFPYSQWTAGVYSSTANNYNGERTFLPIQQTPPSRLVLPPAARLTYPGRWTEAPIGYDGTVPYTVRRYQQALLELEYGWTGEVTLPWMAWEVLGTGQVGIDGSLFTVGSPELTNRLRDTNLPVTSLQVYGNGGLRIVFLVNAVRFDIRARTRVDVRGFDVWAIDMTTTELPPDVASGLPIGSSLKKPLPTVLD